MKQLFSIFFLGLFALNIQAEGINFFEGTWDEAKELAAAEDKIIFVDAYTAWCGPCKRMAKNVFPQKNVGDYYNENFICLKMDMEKGEGPKFAREYSVRSYPTLLYIDGAGQVVHRAVGGKQPDDFIKLGEMVSRKMDKSIDLEKEYENGKRDPSFIYKYVKALNKAGKPSLKISNEYLKTQEDLTTDFNTKFIFEATTVADSRIFNMMIDQKKKIIKMYGQEKFDDKIIAVTNATIDKAIEYESTSLLDEAKNKVAHHSSKERIKLFNLRADKKYHLLTGDVKNYLKSADKFIKEMAGKDAEHLIHMAAEVKKYLSTEKKALSKAEEWAGKAYKLDKKAKHALLLTELLYINEKPEKAMKVAKEGSELAVKEKLNPAQFKQWISKIELRLNQ